MRMGIEWAQIVAGLQWFWFHQVDRVWKVSDLRVVSKSSNGESAKHLQGVDFRSDRGALRREGPGAGVDVDVMEQEGPGARVEVVHSSVLPLAVVTCERSTIPGRHFAIVVYIR